ncbi:MAG: beta-ketoacyl synthase chain length factor [Bacteroidetes bacterium]|nr:beta-ketoacyl synthase chain length factor [Bacteroidota bacterium]
MFYIHQITCISPQQTFSDIDLNILNDVADNKLKVIEPSYEGIPLNILRRMGKAVRIGVGSALPLIKQKPDGIIIGTANGGMEDCIKFLNQIIDYNEGMLAPGNFVQSTTNAVAAQIGLMSRNTGYNITHVHRALAFENAMLDAAMMLHENPSANYLLGGLDEISAYNYNIDYLSGAYKKEKISNKDLFTIDSPGSIAGEGSAMFLVNKFSKNAIAEIEALQTLHTDDIDVVKNQLQLFIEKNNASGKPDLLLSGENGDNRLTDYYTEIENEVAKNISVARFKQMSGEYPTASAYAVWLACMILKDQNIPAHAVKKIGETKKYERIFIYNNYKGTQHSFILVSK